MRLIHRLSLALTAALTLALSGCHDSKTYAQLLGEENKYVNAYLAEQRVVNAIPEDSVFITGPDAPYYKLDEDGTIYMQVIDAGTKGNMAVTNDLIYYRFTRYPLSAYADGEFTYSEGNDDVLGGNYSFRMGNFEGNSSYSAGQGVQIPLTLLPVDCQVNIIVKSQYGPPSEIAQVIPYLYRIRYFRPKI